MGALECGSEVLPIGRWDFGGRHRVSEELLFNRGVFTGMKEPERPEGSLNGQRDVRGWRNVQRPEECQDLEECPEAQGVCLSGKGPGAGALGVSRGLGSVPVALHLH